MSRICTCLTLVVAGLCSNLAFGQVTFQRIDTAYQKLNWVDFSVGAIYPPHTDMTVKFSSFKRLKHPTMISRTFGETVSDGSSFAGQVSDISALNVTPWGVTIENPQITFSAGTVMSASAETNNPGAGAWSGFGFGDSENPCRAYGKYQVIGTANQTGTLRGLMTILMATLPTGDAELEDYATWEIQCGPSMLTGVKEGNSWDVLGGVYVGGVYQDMSGFWPLDINTAFATSSPVQVGSIPELRIDTWDFHYYAAAGLHSVSTASLSSLTGSVSFGSSFFFD